MSIVSPRLRLTIAALSIFTALSGACLVSSVPADPPQLAAPAITPQQRQFHAQMIRDKSNLHEIALAIFQYAQDHNYRLPDANRWMDQIAPYRRDPNVFFDPFQPGQHRYGYAFNRICSQKPLWAFDAPAETVMLFDSKLGTRNAADTGESLRSHFIKNPGGPVLNSGSAYCFEDGHSKWFRPESHPSFSLSGEVPSMDGSDSSLFGAWVSPGSGMTRTAIIFSPGNIIEQVGPWPGDKRKIAHSYGRYNLRQTTLKYIFTRVWVEGAPVYTVTPEKHLMDYTLHGNTLNLGRTGKYTNTYHYSRSYSRQKPKGFLWI